MNYESIAKLVHDLVKNPKSMFASEPGLIPEHNTNEFMIIQNVFSKYEVSGDTLTIEALPLDLWG